MYKFIFELLTDPLGLPIEPLWEYVILLVLNEVAFLIAWNASPGGKNGSKIHWAVRLPSFFVLWAVAYGAIVAAKWIYHNWIIVLAAVSAIIVISVIITIIVLHKKKGTRVKNA